MGIIPSIYLTFSTNVFKICIVHFDMSHYLPYQPYYSTNHHSSAANPAAVSPPSSLSSGTFFSVLCCHFIWPHTIDNLFTQKRGTFPSRGANSHWANIQPVHRPTYVHTERVYYIDQPPFIFKYNICCCCWFMHSLTSHFAVFLPAPLKRCKCVDGTMRNPARF